MDQAAIGSRIKASRERAHLTQEQLAEIVDISPTHMSVIERGVKTPLCGLPTHWASPRMRCCRMWWSTPTKASCRSFPQPLAACPSRSRCGFSMPSGH